MRAKEASRIAEEVPTTSTLVAYESEDEVRERDSIISPTGLLSEHAKNDAQIKAERRARAKEWSRRRKEASSGSRV